MKAFLAWHGEQLARLPPSFYFPFRTQGHFQYTPHQSFLSSRFPPSSFTSFLPVIPWVKSMCPPTPSCLHPHQGPTKARSRSSRLPFSSPRCHAANMPRAKRDLTHLFEGFLYLHQGVPVCDGLPWVCQHLVPVVPSQAFGVDPHTTDSNDLVVTHSKGEIEGLASVTRHALRKGGPAVWASTPLV